MPEKSREQVSEFYLRRYSAICRDLLHRKLSVEFAREFFLDFLLRNLSAEGGDARPQDSAMLAMKRLELPKRMARSTAHPSTGFRRQLHHSTSRSTAPPAVHRTLAAGPVILKYDWSNDICMVHSWWSGTSCHQVLMHMQSSSMRLPTACEPSIILPTCSSSYVHSQNSYLRPNVVLDMCAVDALD